MSDYIKFTSRDWGYAGDKQTWARQNDDLTITVKKAARGTISSKYAEELRAFCEKYGQDFDAIRFGESLTFAAVTKEETAQEAEEKITVEEAEKENTMSREISLNNGLTFMSAHEAMPEIIERDLWDAVANFMDDEIRERVHAEIAPCTEEEFLTRYLELSEDDLVIG